MPLAGGVPIHGQLTDLCAWVFPIRRVGLAAVSLPRRLGGVKEGTPLRGSEPGPPPAEPRKTELLCCCCCDFLGHAVAQMEARAAEAAVRADVRPSTLPPAWIRFR